MLPDDDGHYGWRMLATHPARAERMPAHEFEVQEAEDKAARRAE